MSAIEIVRLVLESMGNFFNLLVDVLGSSVNPDAAEGIIALTAIGIIIRLVDVGGKTAAKGKQIPTGKQEQTEEKVRRRIIEEY